MLSDDRFKEIMEDVGMRDSLSLYTALRSCAREAVRIEREACAKIAEKYEPDEKPDGAECASKEIRARTYGA